MKPSPTKLSPFARQLAENVPTAETVETACAYYRLGRTMANPDRDHVVGAAKARVTHLVRERLRDETSPLQLDYLCVHIPQELAEIHRLVRKRADELFEALTDLGATRLQLVHPRLVA